MSFTSEIKEEIRDKFFDDEKKEFLRRFFLLSGSITNPQKEYHMEILTDEENVAEAICRILREFGISAKIIEKKYQFSAYVKEAENIALFLNIIGAHDALFKFEDAKVLHEMNNRINRVVNCETANLSKIVDAGVRQINSIKKIRDTVGFNSLSEALRDIAVLRLENPELSLIELGKMLSPPIGKSGVNHRLKKLDEIADSIDDKNFLN